MILTILDTKTLQTRTFDSAFGGFWWAEGNGSCDCNRGIEFGVDFMETEFCIGCKRFLIVKSDDPEYSIEEFNSGYKKELKEKYLK